MSTTSQDTHSGGHRLRGGELFRHRWRGRSHFVFESCATLLSPGVDDEGAVDPQHWADPVRGGDTADEKPTN